MSATAIAHPNIALIKYWGKREIRTNLPAVGSLSETLGALVTETTVDARQDSLILNGRDQPGEQCRLTRCLDALREITGETRHARVTSRNDFPTGAGLASSASGYAALVTAAAGALNLRPDDSRLLDIARIGSGSAPRSMFGGFVLLGIDNDTTICTPVLAPGEWPLEVTVAVTSEADKAVTSREGMERSRRTSPYYEAWLESHAADLGRAQELVRARDFAGLAELAEHNCLKMHAVMMTTRPPLLYWSPVSLACMHAVRELREDGVPVFFTVDAGPQVKAVHPPEARAQVQQRLLDVPGVLRLIGGELGEGARLISTDA